MIVRFRGLKALLTSVSAIGSKVIAVFNWCVPNIERGYVILGPGQNSGEYEPLFCLEDFNWEHRSPVLNYWVLDAYCLVLFGHKTFLFDDVREPPLTLEEFMEKRPGLFRKNCT